MVDQNVRELTVAKSIEINAPASKVWDVLVVPQYIKEWDDVPEGFADDRLRTGSILEWPGHAKLTVTEIEPYKHLRMAFVAAKWQPPVPDDIAYTYDLAEAQGKTTLTITVGDFGQLPDGKDYYDASIEFAQTASQKIKELSEH
jgi:uncharacterized protein YndB with AHSA1/START domain